MSQYEKLVLRAIVLFLRVIVVPSQHIGLAAAATDLIQEISNEVSQ